MDRLWSVRTGPDMSGHPMTREWLRVNTGLLDDDDYSALSPMGKAAWHTTNLLAGRQTDEGRFRTVDQLTRLLVKEGLEAAVVEELRTNRWLLVLDDGKVEFKGYRKYQQFRPAAERGHEPSRGTRPDGAGHVRTPTTPHNTPPHTARGSHMDAPPRVDEKVTSMEALGEVVKRALKPGAES